ncbi:MAG: DNA polymerase III psi subunit [Marivirga sp.]
MDIDKDFLPFIFNDDTIYIINDDAAFITEPNQVNETSIEKSDGALITEKVEVSPKAGKPDLVKEETISYGAPKVLVLLANTTDEKEETLLNNILKAVSLSTTGVQRIYTHPAKFNDLKGTKLLLSFHSNYAPTANYEINTINDIQVIYAHDLATLEENIGYKKQLWSNLKQITI